MVKHNGCNGQRISLNVNYSISYFQLLDECQDCDQGYIAYIFNIYINML